MSENSGFQTGRSRQRSLLVLKLLTLPTQRQAALECGISESTVARWLRDPKFVAEMNSAKAEMTSAATNALRASALSAVQTLVSISGNVNAAESSRVAAAARVIEFFIKTSTLESIEARLAQLESGAE
jgi:hypothetical protein